MNNIHVASSSLQSVGYDARHETLEVEFHNGAIYQYYNLPQSMYEKLMEVASKDQFFNAQIRNRFPYSRVG